MGHSKNISHNYSYPLPASLLPPCFLPPSLPLSLHRSPYSFPPIPLSCSDLHAAAVEMAAGRAGAEASISWAPDEMLMQPIPHATAGELLAMSSLSPSPPLLSGSPSLLFPQSYTPFFPAPSPHPPAMRRNSLKSSCGWLTPSSLHSRRSQTKKKSHILHCSSFILFFPSLICSSLSLVRCLPESGVRCLPELTLRFCLASW